MRVIVSGGWSYGNIGDEAIATASIFLLKSFFPDSELIFTSYSPENFQICHSISARKSVHKLLEDANCTESYEEVIKNPNQYGLSAFTDMLESGSVFIMSGGGYFIESSKSLQFLSRLVEIELAKRAGCKVVLMGQSIGPVFTQADRKRVKHALDNCTRIYVRDQSTLNYLKSLNDSANIQFAPDLAVVLPDVIDERKLLMPGERKNTISIMPAHYSLYQRVDQAEKLPRLCETILRKMSPQSINYKNQLKRFILQLSKRHKIRFVMSTNWTWDQSFARSLTDGIDRDRYEFVTCRSTEDLVEKLISTRCLISTKMHPLIIASSYNVPTIGISYNYKVDNYMKIINRDRYCYRIDKINADEMISQVEDIIDNPTNFTGQVLRDRVYEMMVDIKDVVEK